MDIKEEWRYVPYTNKSYMVNNLGDVKSVDRVITYRNGKKVKHKGKLLTKKKNSSGYYIISFRCPEYYKHQNKNNKTQEFVHKIVALTFIENKENKPTVNHINGNKLDNTIKNLEWATMKEQNLHAYRVLGKINPKGMLGKKHKLESNQKRSESHKKRKAFSYNANYNKVVLCFDLEGNFIKEYGATMDIERELNIGNANISACCNQRGKSKKKDGTYKYCGQTCGYIFRYKEDYFSNKKHRVSIVNKKEINLIYNERMAQRKRDGE